MKGILAKKIGMTEVLHNGKVEPVTILRAGPCTIVQKKTLDQDGYNAIQVGFDDKKKVNKPKEGHFKKANVSPKVYLREFRVNDDISKYEVGQTLTVESFKEGEYINVTGLSKGRGFQGVVKRWGFKGGPGSHGSMFHRAPGGIGGRVRVAGHIWLGRKMPGHYGQETITKTNLKIVLIDKDENVMLVRGAIPGSTGELLVIKEALKNERLKLRDVVRKEEEAKRISDQFAKEKAEKEKKKGPARTSGGKK